VSDVQFVGVDPVVAIDGPAGSGKSTVSRGVARRLGLRYLDTGAMYRAMTLAVLDAQVDPNDDASVISVVNDAEISSGTDPDNPFIHLNGRDVSAEIRTEGVTGAVSAVSAIPAVRALLVEKQRSIVVAAQQAGTGIVVEGRDIGTVVLPDADRKFFLTADETERARRRALEQAQPVDRTQDLLNQRDALDSNRSVSPLTQADDAVAIDTTHMTLDEVIDTIVQSLSPGDDLDEAAIEAAAREAALEEFPDLEASLAELQAPVGLPVLAVIGRPNVGKSTLVNRLIGRREAVVEDVPGVTRDRVSYEAEWNGKQFMLLDTGGWDRRAKGIGAAIAAQAERAISEADAIAFVVDATVGATDVDEALVSVIRKSGKPVVLIANKVDDATTELEAASLWSLGLGEPHSVSALQGRGAGDLLDTIATLLPEEGQGTSRQSGPRRIALLGKPNVGKSSLLNALAGEDRVVVDSVAGTTVDPVDELVDIKGTWWWFVDTAGIRRRAKEASGHEYYATLRTQAALERAEVAVVLIDAAEPISEQDVRIVATVIEAGRALVLAFNKWDLTDEERRHYLEREIARELVQVPWAPRVNISARTKRHVDKLTAALDEALAGWETRISTGRLNQFLTELTQAHPHPVRGGKQPRIMYGAQVATCPPTFALFTTGFLEVGYRRFIERRLREEFGFVGSPIRIVMRVREKKRRR